MKDKMLAAVFRDVGKLELAEVPVPRITKDTDVLLKVEAASICGSDLKILQVPPAHPARKGVILGHEYVGRVIEAGDAVTSLKPGDLVAIEPNIPCFKCQYCRENFSHMCDSLETLGVTLDGAFAEYNVAPASQLHLLPPDTVVREAVFIEPLSCVVAALDKVAARPSDLAVVLGAGPLGLLFAEMLGASGARVIVSEPSAMRRRYAESCGVDMAIDPGAQDLASIVHQYSPIGADLVVDSVGSLISQAIPLLRRNGALILFGVNENASSSVIQYQITRNSLRLFGSFIGSGVYPRTIQLIKDRRIDVTRLMSAELPLARIHDGIELLRRQEAVKVLVLPFGDSTTA